MQVPGSVLTAVRACSITNVMISSIAIGQSGCLARSEQRLDPARENTRIDRQSYQPHTDRSKAATSTLYAAS